MSDSLPQKLDKVIQIDEDQIQQHLGELVRGTVEETLNKLLDAEAISSATQPDTREQMPAAIREPVITKENSIPRLVK